MSPTASATILRRLLAPVYLPVGAATLGAGMLIPVLPLYLAEIGLSLRVASVVLAAVGLGAALGGLPAGSLVERLGERTLMIAALVALAILTALLGATTAAAALIALRLGAGTANIALRLSRQTYITRRVELLVRGRAMSLFGGSFRVALLFGPLLGGVLVDQAGFEVAFIVAGGLIAVGLIPALLADRQTLPLLPGASGDGEPAGVFAVVRRHWRLLAVAGVVPLLVMTVREGRFVVVPLIGDELGLGPTEVGALVTVGTAADLLLVPVSGWLMDRFGRLYAMVPSFGLIAVGLVLLGVADTTTGAVVAGAVIGIGNGLSAGTMLTYGSDLAPLETPGPFLAGMGVIQDGGRIAGPLLVGVVGSRLDLGAAAIALALVMVFTIAWLLGVIGETSRRTTEPR